MRQSRAVSVPCIFKVDGDQISACLPCKANGFMLSIITSTSTITSIITYIITSTIAISASPSQQSKEGFPSKCSAPGPKCLVNVRIPQSQRPSPLSPSHPGSSQPPCPSSSPHATHPNHRLPPFFFIIFPLFCPFALFCTSPSPPLVNH